LRLSIFRDVLTQFQDSKFASIFSGRCGDSSVIGCNDGSIFVDADPDVFLKLINFLRMTYRYRETKSHVPVPAATAQFGLLLEYYGLTHCLYPQVWWANIAGKRTKFGGKKGAIALESNQLRILA